MELTVRAPATAAAAELLPEVCGNDKGLVERDGGFGIEVVRSG